MLMHGLRSFTHSFVHPFNKRGLHSPTHVDDAEVTRRAVIAPMKFPGSADVKQMVANNSLNT